ncbi:MAG TPA: hypothetical protein VFQ63_02775, partial [Patescibacteria group bacterium]|nr:hypothetical protein [Patescibacteria group bacterium]
IQILLKQATSEIDTVAKTFYLSDGERQMLISAGVGQGLFFAGQNHVAIQIVAAPFEHEIITSNPEELQKIQEEKAKEAVVLPQEKTQDASQINAQPTQPEAAKQ